MAEYIEREALVKALRGSAVAKYPASFTMGLLAAADEASKIPVAADVAPVRYGRWEIVVGSNGKEYMVCTECRKQQDLIGTFSYCPNCGAKMDGDDNG